MKKEYTASELAILLQLNPRTIRKNCTAGKYKGASKKASAWFIPRASIIEECDNALNKIVKKIEDEIKEVIVE